MRTMIGKSQMSNKIRIYDSGQVYEIDSDQLYFPYFISGRRTSNPSPVNLALKEAMVQLEDKNDTESKEEN